MDTTAPERLADRERPVPEPGLRREQLELDSLLGQRAQGERGLERSDAAAGNEDPQRRPPRSPGKLRSRRRAGGTEVEEVVALIDGFSQ